MEENINPTPETPEYEQEPPYSPPPPENNYNYAFTNFDDVPKPQTPTRRVGTVTLGITLIAVGIVLLLSLLTGDLSVLWVARFSPAILILIGIEIILGYFLNRHGKMKYDFLSMFVCLVLIGTSIGFSIIPAAIRTSIAAEQVQGELNNELNDMIANTIGNHSGVRSAYASIYAHYNENFLDWNNPRSIEEIKRAQRYTCNINVTLKSNITAPAEIAAQMQSVVSILAKQDYRINMVDFYYNVPIPEGANAEEYGDQIVMAENRSVDLRFAKSWTLEDFERELEIRG